MVILGPAGGIPANENNEVSEVVKTKYKKKPNFWLEDRDFLLKTGFQDLYYLETLCVQISNFIKNIPIPVLTSYDSKHKRIYFSIGSDKKGIPINTDVAYPDYITMIRRFLEPFYPKYEVKIKNYISLSDDDILKKVKEGMDMNDALNLTQEVFTNEVGVIERIQMLDDQFILNVNGERELRISGSIQKPLTLSNFLKEFRLLPIEDRKVFLEDNSTIIKKLPESNKEVLITYQGKQLYKFFEINFPDLKQYTFTKIDTYIYKWGKFKIKFESRSLMEDCLSFLEKAKMREEEC